MAVLRRRRCRPGYSIVPLGFWTSGTVGAAAVLPNILIAPPRRCRASWTATEPTTRTGQVRCRRRPSLPSHGGRCVHFESAIVAPSLPHRAHSRARSAVGTAVTLAAALRAVGKTVLARLAGAGFQSTPISLLDKLIGGREHSSEDSCRTAAMAGDCGA